jgi:hypothetical protein
MAEEPEPIKVPSESDLADLLAMAEEAPLVLESNGVRYRLVKEEDDLWSGYDPKRVRAAVAETAGSWADLDADALIADVYRWRAEGSRPATRP